MPGSMIAVSPRTVGHVIFQMLRSTYLMGASGSWSSNGLGAYCDPGKNGRFVRYCVKAIAYTYLTQYVNSDTI